MWNYHVLVVTRVVRVWMGEVWKNRGHLIEGCISSDRDTILGHWPLVRQADRYSQ